MTTLMPRLSENWRDWPLAEKQRMLERLRAKKNHGPAFEFRGAALALQACDAHEVIISGPSETGKTLAALYKLNRLCWENPGAQAVIVRKVRDTLVGTALQTWGMVTAGTDLSIFGGHKPEWFDYPNGARVWIGGMDKPGKVLSADRDLVYVNQAEELTLEDWETLTTRVTGRAGHVPTPQIFGDCNPSSAMHWIKQRAESGALRFLESRHEDNPRLFVANGQLTEQGQRTMAVLDALTGIRRERLRFGRWTSAEGVIYEFDALLHLVDPFPIPDSWRRFRVVDFGFTHPFVCGWWAADEDGRMYLYRQIYMTGRTVRQHAGQIKSLSAGERIEATVCDHDAEDMATLRENDIPTTPAEKAVSVGIQKVQERLKAAGDGRARLFVLRGCLVESDPALIEKRKPYATEQEFDNYRWANKARKEEPVKEDDHGMDMTRYAVMYADAPRAQVGVSWL